MKTSVFAAAVSAALLSRCAVAGFTNNIMIMGYWPPSNEMLTQFSEDASLNPAGWQGENWMDTGYDVHSYFPEFSPDFPTDRLGQGDFTVDYEDSWADFNRIVDDLNPVAIITTSQNDVPFSWEIEAVEVLYRPVPSFPRIGSTPVYFRDLNPSTQGTRPDPNWPIFSDLGGVAGIELQSSLPTEAIRDALNAINNAEPIGTDPADLPVADAYIDETDGAGQFLSGWAAIMGLWYHEQNNDPDAEFRNFAAGHIHVGLDLSVEQATLSTEVTLKALTDYLDTVVPAPGASLALGALGLGVMTYRRRR